jgi:RNA polymerase sigma-70 factor (ECF subfamily)
VSARILSNHRRRRQPLRFEDGAADSVPRPVDEEDESPARVSIVRAALSRLPALQKNLLGAFHFEKRPVAEIAAELGISERGVEGRLRRARQKLRREIESDPGARGELHDY